MTEADTDAVWIPNALYEIQAQIGDKVVAAFEKKAEATVIEETRIHKVETILQK